MDPSADICKIYDTLKETAPLLPQKRFIHNERYYYGSWYVTKDKKELRENITTVPVKFSPPAIYCDRTRYTTLLKVKDSFDVEGFVEARNKTNPFENIGRSIFINRAGVKLANIDAVHHVTNNIFTFDDQQSDEPFTFCDVAAGPGGFTQYLQYRYPQGKGYGMTLRHPTLDWSTKFLDMTRFTPFYGDDNSGDLYTNWYEFYDYVNSVEPNGVDLVTADGGFDLEDNSDKSLLHRQEFLSSRLLLTQCLIGLSCTKLGGNFVVKVFDTVTEFSAQIIYLLARSFEQITIFKPVTSRPANSERYIICLGRNDSTDYEILMNASDAYTQDDYVNNLFSDSLPSDFTTWLTEINTYSIDLQLTTASNILNIIQGRDIDIPSYNIDKFLVIWNLPDTTPRPRDTIIKIR